MRDNLRLVLVQILLKFIRHHQLDRLLRRFKKSLHSGAEKIFFEEVYLQKP